MAVERADGGEVSSSPLARALTEAGFRPTTRGLRLAGGPGVPGPRAGPGGPGGGPGARGGLPGPGGPGGGPGSRGGSGRPRGPDWRRFGQGESPPDPGDGAGGAPGSDWDPGGSGPAD
jgi:hypothetical protein